MYREVPAQLSHVEQIVANLRAEDRHEIAAFGIEPAVAIAKSIEASRDARVMMAGDDILAVYGVRVEHELADTAEVWMLSTRHVLEHKKILLRRSASFVAEQMKHYTRLVNIVDADYDSALRWLCWLGFDIDPNEIMVNGHPFYRVELKA